MGNKRKIISDELQDLFIKIYLVGFELQGESCIFLIYTKEPKKKLLYSIVIDCYEDGKSNVVENICAEELNNEKLDMLVWSHPHDDHTIGLKKIISKYCDRNTKILLANCLNNSKINMSQKCKDLHDYISNLNLRNKNKYDISSMVSYDYKIQEVFFQKSSHIVNEIQIRCIAPIPYIIAKQPALKEEDINVLSVGLLITIDLGEHKMNFLLCSDMLNETFREIAGMQEEDEIPDTYNYIKLPHHGGQSAQDIIKILNPSSLCKIAGTTIFRKTKDTKAKLTNPSEATIRKFRDYIEKISCTSDVLSNSYGTGIIVTEFDVLKGEINVEVKGTAVEDMGWK